MTTADWMMLGGGLAIIAGGAALLMRRRRPGDTDDALAPAVAITEPVVVAPATPVKSAPVLSSMSSQSLAAPVIPVHKAEPVREESAFDRKTPVDAVAGTLEEMVAEAPSKANPFLTRRKRLRRAEYLLRNGQALAGETAAAEPAARGDRWSEVSVGRQKAPRSSWTPARG